MGKSRHINNEIRLTSQLQHETDASDRFKFNLGQRTKLERTHGVVHTEFQSGVDILTRSNTLK